VLTLGDTEGNAFPRLFHGSSNDLTLMHMGLKMHHGIENSFETDVFAVFYMHVLLIYSLKGKFGL